LIWNGAKENSFANSSSFISASSNAKNQSSEDIGDEIDEEELERKMAKGFKLVRRSSWCCSFWGKEKEPPMRKIRDIIILRQQYLDKVKERYFAKPMDKNTSTKSVSMMSKLHGWEFVGKSSLNVTFG
jgi:hypothetical protein